VNAVCTKISAGNYNCICNSTLSGYIYPVTLSNIADNNDKGPTKGCARFNLSNCNIWKVNAPTSTNTLLIASTTYKAFELVCKTCASGYNAWSTATPTAGTITYDSTTTPQLTGPGCPKDGIFDSTCTTAIITWATNAYTCSSCPLTDPAATNLLITFTTSQTQPVTVGCIAQAAYPYDSNCLTYTYNAVYTSVVCNKCKSGTLITADSDTIATKTYTYCTSKTIIPGCSKYVVA